MKTIFKYSAIYLLLGIWGCAPTSYHLKSGWFDPSFKTNGNAYYHYLKSQYDLNNGKPTEALSGLKESVRQAPEAANLKRELAELLLATGDREQALAVIGGLLKTYPQDLPGLKIKADILRKHKMPREAAAVYTQIVALDPDQLDVFLQLTDIHLKAKDFDRALGVAVQMVSHHPRSAAASFLLGSIHLRLRQYQSAETAFLKTIRLKPMVMSPRFELANLYRHWAQSLVSIPADANHSLREVCEQEFGACSPDLKQFIDVLNKKEGNDPSVASKIKLPTIDLAKSINRDGQLEKRRMLQLQQILDIQPDNVRAAMELGLAYFNNNDRAKSDLLLETLGRRSVLEAEIILRTIQLYLDDQKYEEALIVLQGMLKGAPGSSEIHHLIGWTYHDLKRLQVAETHFRRVRRSSIFFKDAITHLAWIFQETGRYEEGIRYLSKIVDSDRDVWEFYYYLAILHENRKNYPQATDLMSKALAINPENEDLLFRMGVILDKWGKKDQSLEQMRKVIRIAPQNANALNYLGYTYAEMGRNLDEAERLVKMALKYKPDDGYITDSMGWILYKKGDYRRALNFLLRATQLEPSDPVILEHIGDTYIRLQNPQRALESYRQSIELEPEDKSRVEKKIMELSR